MACVTNFNFSLYATTLPVVSHPKAHASPLRPHTGRAHRGHASVKAANTVPPQRRSGNYKPDTWDYNFLWSLNKTSTSDEEAKIRRHEELKEEVRCTFKNNNKNMVNLLELVDCLQQLGLGYHFENEIKEALDLVSSTYGNANNVNTESLHFTSLLFRLLRENRYQVPQDVFNKYLEKDGGFGESCLYHGTNAILSLYEASFYAFPNETILDKAMVFSTNHLNKEKDHIMCKGLQEKVILALDLPIHRRMRRIHARQFIDVYSQQDNMNPSILKLAKLDYNMVQDIHRQEIQELSRWFKNMDIAETLPFARRRVVEPYIFAMGTIPQPQYTFLRMNLTKLIMLVMITDDIYDIYGTVDELKLFTDAIQRWNLNELERLPICMKIFYLAFFNTANEIIYHVMKENKLDVTSYLISATYDLLSGFLQEAKWFDEKYVPSPEEYMNMGYATSTLPMMIVFFCVLMGKDLSEKTLESLMKTPNLVMLAGINNRLSNDLGTSKEELKRGDVHKIVQCLMHHEKLSKEEARAKTRNVIDETWKKLNKERLDITEDQLPITLVDAIIDTVRIFHFFYKHGDEYGSNESITKSHFRLLVLDSV